MAIWAGNFSFYVRKREGTPPNRKVFFKVKNGYLARKFYDLRPQTGGVFKGKMAIWPEIFMTYVRGEGGTPFSDGFR